MTETPFGPLESLVGRTFERDGLCRIVTLVNRWYVFWRRPPLVSIVRCVPHRAFLHWLSGATEVNDGQG